VAASGTADAAYDAIAEWYDQWVGGDDVLADPLFAALAPFLGEVAGQRVCDLACGQGRVARYLAAQGARVLGVDVSARMLAIARQREAEMPRGIDYLQADAHSLGEVADASFDGVVCHMALMDIPDLDAAVRTVSRILRPGGWFAFSILHPCFNAERSGEIVGPDGALCRFVGGYFAERHWRSTTRPGPPGKVGVYHRTLSTYLNALTGRGLAIERVGEPRAGGAFAERRPIWSEVPAALIVRCRRIPRGAE
jgi:SAM-dependent methyltransferase